MSKAHAATEGLDTLVGDYCAAWSEHDGARRWAMLERVWAADGTYTDPSAHVAGRSALDAHIAMTLREALPPGASIVATTHVDAHHGRFRFGWKGVLPDGSTFLEGTDFGEVDDDGRILRIVGFFGALSSRAGPASAPVS
ncbi:MAG: nuclear transport factor 2 family protein [Betaproteobacteria bacterium]|nr:MAG: nuclear transport factor 2 family protein [Betaproteobacteria bacterium]